MFELIKLHNKTSRNVKKWSEIAKTAKAMVKWLDDTNGEFKGQHNSAYAVHHTQVSEEPYNFFVVAEQMCQKPDEKKNITEENYVFPARIIINPKVVKKEKVLMSKEPNKIKKIDEETGKEYVDIEWKDKEVKNKITVKEGCMSFPHRKSKNVQRYYRVTVRYQIKTLIGLKEVEETIEGVKAHIFQHECDHAKGNNIFYDK